MTGPKRLVGGGRGLGFQTMQIIRAEHRARRCAEMKNPVRGAYQVPVRLAGFGLRAAADPN
jgi:hypothetical protein